MSINFDDVSLIDLITNQKAKQYLVEAEVHRRAGDFEKCAEKCNLAYLILISGDPGMPKSDGSPSISTFFKNRRIHYSSIGHSAFDRSLENSLNTLKENQDKITNSILITSLGIDFRKYIKFIHYTPSVFQSIDEFVPAALGIGINLSDDICLFLINFVLELSLKIQEFEL